tara:strand:+ start:261 stop:473 length:213 start_codon:yes stop_codon:yes gene_type:complete
MILFDSVIFIKNTFPKTKEVWISKEYIVQLSEYQPSISEPKYTRLHLHNGKVIIVDLEMAAAAEIIGVDE